MSYTGKVISGDCHLDIPWLPEDLFTSRAPAHLYRKNWDALWEAADEYERHLFHLGRSMKPSERWARQGCSTFQIERLTNEMIDPVREDNIMWGSDYPHPDCVRPDSRSVINEHLGHLDESNITKPVCDNSAKP